MSVCALPTHIQKIKQECLFYSVLGGKTPFQATNRQKLDIPSFNLVEETFVKFFYVYSISGCTSGGVYEHCIYSHARCELP